MPYTYPFPMVSATATILIIMRSETDNLMQSTTMLARRAPHVEVYPNMLSLVGGFLNSGKETIEEAAVRELKEETGLDIEEARLRMFKVSSKPGTDPRAHVVNVCYWVEVSAVEAAGMKPADDVSELTWVGVGGLLLPTPTPLAFNHNKLAVDGLRHWRLYNELPIEFRQGML